MKKILIPILLVAVSVLACNITTPTIVPPPTQPPVIEPPVVTEPPVIEPPVLPPAGNLVTCSPLSFLLDPALATGYDCQSVPEGPYEMAPYPAHTKVVLQGYPLTGRFFEPQIMVFSVAAYTSMAPAVIPGDVSGLQAMITSGSIPAFPGPFISSGIPLLPIFNAGQVFYARAQVLPFVNGSGVRFLAEYAQLYVPVNNYDLFYTYQGLTSDGQHWISAILPINLAMLPASADPLPGGMSFEDFANNYTAYINDMVTQLNAQPADSYIPTLTLLDALVSSFSIAP